MYCIGSITYSLHSLSGNHHHVTHHVTQESQAKPTKVRIGYTIALQIIQSSRCESFCPGFTCKPTYLFDPFWGVLVWLLSCKSLMLPDPGSKKNTRKETNLFYFRFHESISLASLGTRLSPDPFYQATT